MQQPNVLFIMTDQQRFDTIAALGNADIYTPNFDRLVARGASFTHGYSTCPVCVAARYTVRTGREPWNTGHYSNAPADLVAGQPAGMEDRCGPYLARTMHDRGYRTFGVGKFHTAPWDENLGYDVHLHSEELYGTPEQRKRDAFAAFIREQHPAYDFIEGLMGERTEMYYMPQMSPTPAEATFESWAADRAVEQIYAKSKRPYFGLVSFIGPHPPFAPPIPFNRMYNPDRMPNPVRGDLATDHMDEYLPFMNHLIWAEDINDPWARVLKARYYGEISYIDHCLGRILDAVDSRPDADNTLICFYADHGDHLGDHHSWQKESFFDAACRVPFLLSWPARLPRDTRVDGFACLTDLFGIATRASGEPELRDGSDVLGALLGEAPARERVVGTYGNPGTRQFKVMVREGDWKYIFMANGGREQLFSAADDPAEVRQRAGEHPEIARQMRKVAVEALTRPNADRALDGGELRAFSFEPMERVRIQQFDRSRGVEGFPEQPGDIYPK
jgi:arylsulfatase